MRQQYLQDLHIVVSRVNAQLLGRIGKALERLSDGFAGLAEQVGGHGDFLLHHIGKHAHQLRRIYFDDALHKFAVRQVMPHFIARNGAADARQQVIALFGCQFAHPLV